jgi:hypothetical protein
VAALEILVQLSPAERVVGEIGVWRTVAMSKLEIQHDELEGRQIEGKMLETFRDNGTGAIRIRGGAANGFTILVQESGEVTIRYEDRALSVAPGQEVRIEMKLPTKMLPSPYSRRRVAR